MKRLTKEGCRYTFRQMRLNASAYLFLIPFMLLFLAFTLAPVVFAVGYGFTYFNILEPAKFIGLKNYITMVAGDDIFPISIKNTLVLAGITGPIGYLASLLFAWFINELTPKVRAVMVTVFYAPTISGAVFLMWSIIFSADSYGFLNAWLLNQGFISSPINWLTNPEFMMGVVIVVILWMSLGTSFLSFVAGFQNLDRSMYEAGYVDGIQNRWQELWYITLPALRPQMMFGAVMAIVGAFSVGDVPSALCGFPSTDYAVHTIINHIQDYGTIRFDMGYACALSTVLFLTMFLLNELIQHLLKKVGQ